MSNLKRLTTFLVLGISLAGTAAAAPDTVGSRTMILACTQTQQAYAWYRDRLDYTGYGGLFTADAVLLFPGGARQAGRAAIVAALRERGPGTVTRHVITPVLVTPEDDNHATGVSYVVVYSHDAGAEQSAPVPVAGAAAIGEYHDRYLFDGQDCRIEQRELRLIMSGPGQSD